MHPNDDAGVPELPTGLCPTGRNLHDSVDEKPLAGTSQPDFNFWYT